MPERRISVKISQYDCEIVGRVRYNSNLDFWDGRNYTSGSTGRHEGLTKLKDGRYVLIEGTQWDGESDTAYIISKEEALQKILRSGSTELLRLKKFKELKQLHDEEIVGEYEEEED